MDTQQQAPQQVQQPMQDNNVQNQPLAPTPPNPIPPTNNPTLPSSTAGKKSGGAQKKYVLIIIAVIIIALILYLLLGHGSDSVSTTVATTTANVVTRAYYPYFTENQSSAIIGYGDGNYMAYSALNASTLANSSAEYFLSLYKNTSVTAAYGANYTYTLNSTSVLNPQIREIIISSDTPKMLYSYLLQYSNDYNPLNGTYDGMVYSVTGLETNSSAIILIYAYKENYVAIVEVIDNQPVNETQIINTLSADLENPYFTGITSTLSTTTMPPNSTGNSTLNQTALESCGNFTISIQANKTSQSAACIWQGGNMTLNSIVGPNSTLGYSISSFNSSNTTVVSSFIPFVNGTCSGTVPSAYYDRSNYLVQIRIYGQPNSSMCGQPSLKLSTS